MGEDLERRITELEAQSDVLEDALTWAFQAMSDPEERRVIAMLLSEKIDTDQAGAQIEPSKQPYAYRELITVEKLIYALGQNPKTLIHA